MVEKISVPLLEVKDLQSEITTKHGVVRPVNGVSFSVYPGETLGIVGESGSGKSMTGLSILKLLPRPIGRVVAGSIIFNGEQLLDKTEREMRKIRGGRIGMILQDPQTSLNPAFTIGNQISEALGIHTTYRRLKLRNRCIDLLRKVGVAAPEHRVRAYPHQMSGGMRQRVVGAISISCDPAVIIADEPTTSLDVTMQAQYLRLLKEIQSETGLSIVFITHDFGIVATMCQRLIVMYAGKVVESGNVQSLFDRPLHPYTMALLDSVPKLKRRSTRLPTIQGQPPSLWDLPKGCSFAPRCAFADARCHELEPPSFASSEVSEGEHYAKCWRMEESAWPKRAYSKSRI